VDIELVMRAQRGDRAAFGLLATEIATRFLAVSRRILRDIDLERRTMTVRFEAEEVR